MKDRRVRRESLPHPNYLFSLPSLNLSSVRTGGVKEKTGSGCLKDFTRVGPMGVLFRIILDFPSRTRRGQLVVQR